MSNDKVFQMEFGKVYGLLLNKAARKGRTNFVGNHHLLSERQRLALARITSPHASLEGRERKRLREAPEALVLDGVLSRMENIVTADAIILDKCGSWYNLNHRLIEETIPEAWIFRLEEMK